MRQFVQRTVAAKGEVIAEAECLDGRRGPGRPVAPEDYSLLVPALVRGDIEAEVVYRGPLVAPVAEGQPWPISSSGSRACQTPRCRSSLPKAPCPAAGS
jgi:hypothetical protein